MLRQVPRLVAQPLPAPPVYEPAQPVHETVALEVPSHWQLALPDSQDPVTHLGNRSLLEEEVQRAIDNRAAVNPPCLMLVSLDRQRTVDGRPTDIGVDISTDSLQIALAERLRRVVRPSDLVARLDGDDFAVLFEDVRRSDVDAVHGRIMTAIGEPLSVGGHDVVLQVTHVITQAREGEDATQVMLHAATALALVGTTSRIT